MINTITSALSGLNSASKQIEQSSQNIADGSSAKDPSSAIEDIIDIKVAETSYKANIEVLKTADELTRELLHAFDETV